MPVQAKPWTFRQKGGRKKVLVLAAHSAPFGRPRQKPVVRDGIELRQNTVYYPGNDDPTRHIFGVKYQDFELTGRFGDREFPPQGGEGYAKARVREIKQFVADQQPVTITWGDILSVDGLIDLFDPGRESEAEVEWRMRILIDRDNDADQIARRPAPQNPGDVLTPALKQLGTFIKNITDSPDLKPGFLDSIENLVASANGSIAFVGDAVNKITTFEKAIVGDVKRLRAGMGQLTTAMLDLQQTTAAADDDLFLIRRSSDHDTSWRSTKIANEIILLRVLALIGQVDRQAEIAEHGKTQSTYIAKLGDSWEGISMGFFSGPDRAQAIRDANGVRYGAAPVAGTTYKIPLQ